MKMVTRTFRINPEYDKILNEEAKRHGLSVSALLNQIIRQYVLVTRFTDKVPAITMSYRSFEPLLDHIDDEDLLKEAQRTGAILPEEALLQRGEKLDLDTLSWFIEEVYGRYGNWFDSTISVVNGQKRIHLSHEMTQKWSIYLKGYITSMFSSVLDLHPTIETRPNSITINLPKASHNRARRRVY